MTMNSKRGHIVFSASGNEYALRFSTNALVRYQDAMSETLLQGLEALQENPSDIRRVRSMFWAALPGGMSETEVGDLIDDVGLTQTYELISKAAEAAFPPPDTQADVAESSSAQSGAPGNARKPRKSA